MSSSVVASNYATSRRSSISRLPPRERFSIRARVKPRISSAQLFHPNCLLATDSRHVLLHRFVRVSSSKNLSSMQLFGVIREKSLSWFHRRPRYWRYCDDIRSNFNPHSTPYSLRKNFFLAIQYRHSDSTRMSMKKFPNIWSDSTARWTCPV